MPPDANCPLCAPDSAANADILWQDANCRVVWVNEPGYPGFCRVILHSHVKEMTDLPEAERLQLMRVVFAVERALREVLKPDKINLASLGNQVPHLHWHIIPRFAADPHFPDAIWAAARRPAAAPGDLAALRARLLTALSVRLPAG